MSYDNITIKTNNQYRPVLSWFDLSAKEQAEFDYLDTEDRQIDASFVRYRGVVYDLGEFMDNRGLPAFHPFQKWQGHHTDSYFSGILVKWSHDFETVKVGTYFS